MPSLLDMTDVPLTYILENCDFKSVLTLRKVCHPLRNFIDDTNIQTDLGDIHITINPDGISLIFISTFFATYDSAKKRTSYDLKTMWYLQNLTIFCLCVDTKSGKSRVLDYLVPILKSVPRPFKTEKLEMRISNGSEILRVLPYLDPKILKRIEISPVKVLEGKVLDGMDRIFELEQFKQAVGFTVNGFVVKENLRNFFHLERIRMKFQHISFEDLVALKVEFTTSTHMKYYALEGHQINEDRFEELFDINGFVDAETEKKSWWFKIQNSKEHVLKVEFVLGKLIFRRKKLVEMPDKARVMDSFIGNF